MQQPPQYPYHQPDPVPTPAHPGRIARFRGWYREQPRYMRVVVGIIGAGIVIFVVAAAISGVVQGIQNPIVIATPQPTARPTATPVRHGPTLAQINDLIQNTPLEATVVSYDQTSALLVLSTNFGYKVSVDQSAVKAAMQQVQVAFWKQGWYFSSLTVNVVHSQQSGPDLPIGSCVLKYATASQIDWSNPPDLWGKYDSESIASSVPS